MQQLLECLPALGLLLCEDSEVWLLLTAQVKECLVLGLVEESEGLGLTE